MRPLATTLALTLFVSGCAAATLTSGEALCQGSRAERAALAKALADTPDEAVLQAGAALILVIDAGCSQ